MFEISIFFIYRILQYAKRMGIAPETILKNTGIDLLGMGSLDSKISERYYYQVLDEAIMLTRDNLLGLHMGEFAELKDLSNLGYIMANCEDLGEAIDSAIDYVNFIGAPVDLQLVRSVSHGELFFKPKQEISASTIQCLDEAISSILTIAQSITKKRFKLKEARFAYPTPDDLREHKRIFHCPLLFTQPISALVFHSRDLLAPVIRNNSKLLLLAQHYRNYIKDIVEEKEYSRKLTILLFAQLRKGPPCIRSMARELGMSVRCLQMRLSEEGVTFRQVVKDVRRELAKTYLEDKDYSIDEITFLLGFSEPSVFHRAFKHWTGLTPGEFRNVT